MTPPPTNIDGTDITGATIDGTEVTEITVDGDTVFTATQPVGQDTVFEDWADNRFTNRDTFATTPYEFTPLSGSLPTTRPEWSIEAGSPSLSNSELIMSRPSSGGSQDVITVDIPNPDFSWSTLFLEMNINNFSKQAFIIILTDFQNGLRLDLTTDGRGVLISEYRNGNFTGLDTFAFSALTPGNDFDVRLNRTGDTVEVFGNSNSLGTVTSDVFPNNDYLYWGHWLRGATSTTKRIEFF